MSKYKIIQFSHAKEQWLHDINALLLLYNAFLPLFIESYGCSIFL